jgi:uncharacterized protein
MADHNPPDASPLAAGPFADWLIEVQAAIRGEQASDVPCGTCTACCTSSQFIHIAPDETDALAHIPRGLTFPAPRAPKGHVLMGYNQQGHCPMLVDGACSIYDHRPRTCRTYDCRVFPAAGLNAGDDGKDLIARQARRWQFSHPTPADQAQHAAVRAAAAYMPLHAADLPEGSVPPTATHLAVLAVEMHDLFLGTAGPDISSVRVALSTRRRSAP